MSTKVLTVISAFVICSVTCGVVSQGRADRGEEPPVPPTRMIPGITTEDSFPGGCVSCHLNYVDMNMDTRISTLMTRLTEKVEPRLLAKAQGATPTGVTLLGRHPEATESLGDIPSACLECHDRAASKAPDFSRMIHSIHLTGGDENHYLTLFQGECTHCHKLDASTGAWRTPSESEK